MQTPDVKPTRLDRAKLLVQSLVDGLQGERVGLEAFAGTAFLQAPLSPDYEILREFLPSLHPDLLPVGGTNYGSLIDTAAGAFGDSLAADRFLIVLSDGGATDDDWRSHVDKLRAKNIRVIGLGVGTAGGALIPDGAGGLVKDGNGAVVLARLESDNLRELAEKTGGTYRDASEWIDLPALLRATVEAGHKGKFVEKNQVRHLERFQWALAPALLCLLLSFWREFPVRPTPRDLRLGAAAAGRPAGPGRRPAAAALVLGLIAGLAPRAHATDDATAPEGAATSAPLAHIVGRIANAGDPQCATTGRNSRTARPSTGASACNPPTSPCPPARCTTGSPRWTRAPRLDAKAADWPRLRRDLEAPAARSRGAAPAKTTTAAKEQQQKAAAAKPSRIPSSKIQGNRSRNQQSQQQQGSSSTATVASSQEQQSAAKVPSGRNPPPSTLRLRQPEPAAPAAEWRHAEGGRGTAAVPGRGRRSGHRRLP